MPRDSKDQDGWMASLPLYEVDGKMCQGRITGHQHIPMKRELSFITMILVPMVTTHNQKETYRVEINYLNASRENWEAAGVKPLNDMATDIIQHGAAKAAKLHAVRTSLLTLGTPNPKKVFEDVN